MVIEWDVKHEHLKKKKKKTLAREVIFLKLVAI